MKRAFWILAAGALLSALVAASIGRAEDEKPQAMVEGAAR